VRAKIARWLIEQRCPRWDLALVVAGELHSATEAFWHGIDETHPLHELPSAIPSADRLRAVYSATDALVGELISACPDATVVAFSMNGMGPNRSDVASMALLSELLYRDSFKRPLLRVSRSWQNAPGGMPMLGRNEDWSQAVKTAITQHPEPLDTLRRIAARTLPEPVKRVLRPTKKHVAATAPNGALRLGLEWMPTDLYEPHWHAMRCFALPSFYDGRVRLNLKGRERKGIIEPADYDAECDRIEALVRACRDSKTGEPVVDHVERSGGDPVKLGPSESDLVIVWRVPALGLEHPEHGRIGPIPYRRTGGHTGPYGMAYFAGEGIAAGDFGVRSSFDVVPTLVDLLGEKLPAGFSGERLFAATNGR
jgi:predicted AlkP superfamily phosphohydrolase/phosphomutase